jgi:hypothetical protein
MDYQRDSLGSFPPMAEEVTSTAEYLRALKQNNEFEKSPAAVAAGLQQSAPDHAERRRNPRYKCEGSAEFRSEGSDIRTWATITDLSRGGCYVEVQATSPRDTPVDMVIDVKGVRARVRGVVRVSYPFLGMGIAFTEITDDSRARLNDILLRLAGQALRPIAADPATASATLPDLARVSDAAAALKAVAKFFQTSPALTREEFAELIFESQR